MKWCCSSFKDNYETAGERGFGVLIERIPGDGRPAVILQHRALDMDVEPPYTQHPMSLISQMWIAFCPFCGADLMKCYGKEVDRLARPRLMIPQPGQ